MENILHDDSKNEALCAGFPTPGADRKNDAGRIGDRRGFDRSGTDMNRDAIGSLWVEAPDGGRYMVGDLWKKGDDATRTEIPVKAVETDRTCRIVYMTPVWNGSLCGDETIACGETASGEPNHSSARAFVASFYDAYTSLYCAMREGRHAKFAALRVRRPKRRAIRPGRIGTAGGRTGGYDLLIDDFDCLWRGSFRIAPCRDRKFTVSCKAGKRVHRIAGAEVEEGGSYRIAGAEVNRP